jgi:prepilin signal peptidase PulO-like enzyme (type II secretory pathway)
MIMLMNDYLIYLALALLGLCMGSFAGASVWRIRARQLAEDKKAGDDVDSKEYKKLIPLTKVDFTKDRSRCLSCGHELSWYDLLPLVSWLSTFGRCRYCKANIGKFEPVIEIGTALFFTLSFTFWPESLSMIIQMSIFVLWLMSGVLLAMLFAYDLKWFLLPNQLIFPLIALGGCVAALNIFSTHDIIQTLLSLVSAVMILSGLYLALWLMSKGQWIGFGDVKLGLGLALLLSDWRLAFIALFAANLIGCIIVIPGLLMGKMTRSTHVPFGPLLIMGAIGAMLFGQSVIEWYTNSLI